MGRAVLWPWGLTAICVLQARGRTAPQTPAGMEAPAPGTPSPTTVTAAQDLRAGSASWVSAVLLPEGRVPSAWARAQPGSCPSHRSPRAQVTEHTLSAPGSFQLRGLPPCPGFSREGCTVSRAERGAGLCFCQLGQIWERTSAPRFWPSPPLLPGKSGSCPVHVVIWALRGWGLCFSWLVSSVEASPPGQHRGSQGGLATPLPRGTGRQGQRRAC